MSDLAEPSASEENRDTLGRHMELNSESLRFILGLKLRQYRLDHGWGLKDVASRTGLSVSYLSEIEKGRKYPKPDKLIQIAKGLNLTYDTRRHQIVVG
ncbi:MAG: helix-turn-helix transcriptional regulator, partial [Acidobacteriota bacterium]